MILIIVIDMLQCFFNQNAHVYMVVFFVKSKRNTYPKGRALMQMYRVVPLMKRGNVVANVIHSTCIRPSTSQTL